MRQFITIATNAFMELIRQPVFLLLMSTSVIFQIVLATPYYFAFGDEPKLVKNSTLAVMLLSGLLGAVLMLASLAREFARARPWPCFPNRWGRAQFLLAKYAGLIAALTVLTYVNLIGTLLASRMALMPMVDRSVRLGRLRRGTGPGLYVGRVQQFLPPAPFVSDAVFCVVIMLTLAFVAINFYTKEGKPQAFATGVDWRLIPAAVLILFALWILAGLALACSTRFDIIPTLAICSTLFLLGLCPITYLAAQPIRIVVGSVLYTVTPNWQLFWLADALDTEEHVHWNYVGKAFAYVVGYVGAVLALAWCCLKNES